MEKENIIHRKKFLQQAVTIGAGSMIAPQILRAKNLLNVDKKIRVGVIGCGSVSRMYFPHLSKNPYAELVCTCDIIPERAQTAATKFNIPKWYPNITEMLAGTSFDIMVNLTNMQEHEHLNRQAIQAGRNVWSEKPMANSYKAGAELLALAKSKNVRIWGAPCRCAKRTICLHGANREGWENGKSCRGSNCALWASWSNMVRFLL